MGFFASNDEHEVVVKDRDGTEGKVWIREISVKGDAKKLGKTLKFNMKGGKTRTSFDAGENRMYDLYEGIKRWDFTDDQGNPVPVTRQQIDKLSMYVASQIQKALDDLNTLPEDREDEDVDDEDSDPDDDEDDEDTEDSEADRQLVSATANEEDPTTAG